MKRINLNFFFSLCVEEERQTYMPKSKTKKYVSKLLIPEKPTANLTNTMRTELYATPESFENAAIQPSSAGNAVSLFQQHQ